MTEFWEKTIQVYNNYIDYPQLTEKYLKRPPFKYIFQIFLTLNTKTNFAKDVFKEAELNPDYYDTPEKKMAFLKQILKIVYEANSKPAPLKPQSIIKGTECDKTNEFLQDMYQVAVSYESKKKNPVKEEKPQKPVANAKEDKPKVVPQNVQEVPKPNIEKPVAPVQSKPLHTLAKELPAEHPTKLVNGKENLVEKKTSEGAKIAQQLADNASKEEKMLSKNRVNSGSQNEKGIKMGKLSSVQTTVNGKSNADTVESDFKEINYDEIKSILQKLTQNTNPMGKLVEFVDDDLDAMNKECKKWLRAFGETEEKLQKIEEDQNDEMQNFHYTLNELTEQIFDYENKILSIRSRIQKNSGKIDSMLSKVIG